ncbi:thiol:disulfide interchange protein DsbA/DsbL [Ignatzschineria indica]|uniref:thiol:disulfide interchange protein DsbA/DsbL n=1 Tax=Ignatzschineria indica TaxID=472583 RepID=UPI002578F08D|nr:thiol:disulfide interchange protein DsbA/DsbL [Ignatzschineria indica]MDM1544985.1 thiol:disulfide interchange protein DsbA/DsbL [Ignatzschineria indica]
MLNKIIATSALILATTFGFASAENYYTEISPAVPAIYNPDEIEVVEIFSYACPACNTFEPYFAKWAKEQDGVEDVAIIPLAAPGQGVWTLYAHAFYTLDSLNALDKGHQAFFDAIHKEKKRFINKEQIADFMATQGIDKDQFLKAWDSFSTVSALNRAANLINEQYKIPFTPAVVIDGRYLLSANEAAQRPGNQNPYEKLIITIDEVVQKVRDERDREKESNITKSNVDQEAEEQ